MKKLMVAALLIASFAMQAQPVKVSLQASGLTCSMCSNAINKALKTLDFVDKVDANIKNSSFEVTFKEGTAIDFDKMKQKVENAGFSVAQFSATIHFDNVAAKNDNHFTTDGRSFHFLGIKDQVLNGDQTVRIIDKGFVTSKEYKKNGLFTKMECYKTGTAGDCCKKDGLGAGTRIYHVTI